MITTLRAPLLDTPEDWQESLGNFFKAGSISGPKNNWSISLDGMRLQVIVHDQPLLEETIDKAARYDIEETEKGKDWIKKHHSHAVIVVQGQDMFEMKLLASHAAQIIGAQALLWDDNAYIRADEMARIADGTLPEVFSLFSIAAWEDADETYGFIVQGLEHILDGWLVMPVLTNETHAYSRTLARITMTAALLGEQGLANHTVIADPTEPEQTLGIVREENLIYLFVQNPETAPETP